MFISVLDLFKLGIGPSSSHTNGPMLAANLFRSLVQDKSLASPHHSCAIKCILKGSLAHTGIGHGTDKAIILGLHGYLPEELADQDLPALLERLSYRQSVYLDGGVQISFEPDSDIIFDTEAPSPQHPNGMDFQLLDEQGQILTTESYFSIGGGFVMTQAEISSIEAPIKMQPTEPYPYPFDTAQGMLTMSETSGLSIADMKRANELAETGDHIADEKELSRKLQNIWLAMRTSLEQGLNTSGILPGGLNIERRAALLYKECQAQGAEANLTDWLCAYAMAVNEENAAGHAVVTAPTNGAAGVIPAVIYYYLKHENGQIKEVEDFLLTASAIGGLIKHRSSISGAEVGCQGEVGSAAAMAAAGLCAVKGGSPKQIENAAEIALEHHLGMTCDPVKGLVQVPCIERNGFGAIKAHTAASLALKGSGEHFMPLDSCIAAMRQTGMEMSEKYKETALGGLAQSWTEC